MTSSSAPRLVLGALAALTMLLTVGGSAGLWSVGPPASGDARPEIVSAAAGPSTPMLRRTAAHVFTRDMEGNAGSIPRTQTAPPDRIPLGSAAPDSGTPDSGDVAARRADARAARAARLDVPARSGTGRRVVFDQSLQRVWLVGKAGRAQRTYPVSGSKLPNLEPGRYEVYSRSRDAVSYTYNETMRFMVRFAHGEQAAIGFHDIPVDRRGRPVQTRAQLGQPLSAGCVRQARPDAKALWRFADIGTRVVVVR